MLDDLHLSKIAKMQGLIISPIKQEAGRSGMP